MENTKCHFFTFTWPPATFLTRGGSSSIVFPHEFPCNLLAKGFSWYFTWSLPVTLLRVHGKLKTFLKVMHNNSCNYRKWWTIILNALFTCIKCENIPLKYLYFHYSLCKMSLLNGPSPWQSNYNNFIFQVFGWLDSMLLFRNEKPIKPSG